MIREMIYNDNRFIMPRLLHMDMYKGYEYIILSLGFYPTAYVRIPKTSKFYGYEEIFDTPLEDIPCHYGITYTSPRLKWKSDSDYECTYSEDMGWWFIGWDYNHAGDYATWVDNGADFIKDLKRWTTTEIIAECRDVIEEIIRLENDNE